MGQQMRCFKDGLLCQAQAIKAGLNRTIFASNQLITLYSKHGFLQEARTMFDEMLKRSVFSWNAIISAYVRSHNLTHARELFNAACVRDLVSYNSMLSGYVSNDGYEADAVELFMEMQRENKDGIRIDEFSVTTMLNLCAKLSQVCYGKQLHGFMAKTSNDRTGFAISSLIHMYSKCGCFREACLVFDSCVREVVDVVVKNTMVAACCREGDMEMALKIFRRKPELNDTVSWNTMISGYAQNGHEEESLRLFVSMRENGFEWNSHTFASVLSVTSGLKSMKLGNEIHSWLLKNGLFSNPFVSSGIVDVYSKCGNMKYAESVHSVYGVGNTYSVSSMIVGYSSQGNMIEARRLFDSLSQKNPVVWTAMYSGYLKSQQSDVVFELLQEYIAKESMVHDPLILVNVLGACSLQAALDPGKQIHAYVLRYGIEMDKKLVSALIDMYSKCGNIKYAEKVFQEVNKRDSVIYNVMIAGYAHHGHDIEAIRVFEEMIGEGFKPDEITFLALLSACRHRGLIETGEKYFNSMIEVYNISPEVDHCTCMIDLYGRANRLDKAMELMKRSHVEEDVAVVGAFLNACKLNRNVELAKDAEEKVLRIEEYNGSRYVQLANVYASEGKWNDMGRIRKRMRGKEFKKFAGCSWLYVENRLHMFTSFGISHLKTEAIYSMLDFLTKDLSETAGNLVEI